ncbi:MAG: RNA polymerase sporulation sigma factor SigG [Candidatus Fournierella pullistercoris]|uniref:RNA polymerase sigma factor n=1 Tax=Candidatus Allofournierella pullistercoris TaxID=2838597 RepID=A0A948T1I2_9FIRM|nr:RNA polymerase sporulation sigma factor SigG [Candidatus Fournierella pullistercoris]
MHSPSTRCRLAIFDWVIAPSQRPYFCQHPSVLARSVNVLPYNKVEICGVNTSHLPVLKESEKKELMLAARQGDLKARQRMIQGNLRLVLSVVQRFAGRGECMDDLFQVGCIGLIKAIDNFDPCLNVRFSTYGVPMIVGEIRRFLRDNNTMRVSRSVRDVAYHAMQTKEQLQKELGKEPSLQQVAQRLELPLRTVTLALESVVEPISLYEPVYSDGTDTLYVMDQVGGTDSEESWISGIMLKDTLHTLPSREKQILQLRYLMGKTQMEVAQEIGISQAQVSRLEKQVMGRIRSQL